MDAIAQDRAKIINDLDNYAHFYQTWAFKRYIRLSYKIIGLFTGMRVSEIMNLKGTDINYTTNQIRVVGKGSNGCQKERFCEMNAKVKLLLLQWEITPHQKIFKRNFQRKLWLKVVNKLGLNTGLKSDNRIWRVTPHTLRHSFGSWLGQAGVSPQVIQQAMGHESIQTSMRYSKLGPRASQKAVGDLTEGINL